MVSKSTLTDVLCDAAVAPIMNVVFRLSVSTALHLLASHRQEETAQRNDEKYVDGLSGRLGVSFPGRTRHWCVGQTDAKYNDLPNLLDAYIKSVYICAGRTQSHLWNKYWCAAGVLQLRSNVIF